MSSTTVGRPAEPEHAPGTRACDACLRRPWLLARLAGHLERARGRIGSVLELCDEHLIAAIAGRQRASVDRELESFEPGRARERAESAGLELVCRCDPGYPASLVSLAAPPAVLHVAGGLERFIGLLADEPVAIVGARRPSAYGLDLAQSLGRGLGSAGVTVISGMALGIDSAAHAGAIAAGAPTVAVLPGGADRPYPAGKRALARQIVETGVAISELPPGTGAWRWMFPARNRIIAGLGGMTVVVEAGARSGALVTAALARELGRSLGAVPGRVTAPLAAGPNALLAAGAHLVTGPQDVLDCLFGAGIRHAHAPRDRAALEPEVRRLLAAVADGRDTAEALSRAGLAAADGLAALAALELGGHLRREAGGRWVVVP